MEAPRADIEIIYDGDCPFCARYVQGLRLRKAAGRVELIDARTDQQAVDRLQAKGFDLNEGMAVVIGDQVYFGDDSVHKLALMSTPSGVFNRAMVMLFRRRRLARLLYPVFRTGRNVTLRVLGRRSI